MTPAGATRASGIRVTLRLAVPYTRIINAAGHPGEQFLVTVTPGVGDSGRAGFWEERGTSYRASGLGASNRLIRSGPGGVVTVPRPEPDLNPHAPDLRKPAAPDSASALSHDISAGQVTITMCPRGDLNTQTRAISPDRGNYAVSIAGKCPRFREFASSATAPVPAARTLDAVGRGIPAARCSPAGHALHCPRILGRRKIRRYASLAGKGRPSSGCAEICFMRRFLEDVARGHGTSGRFGSYAERY
jgi:hypothetical protein